ncbi:hypothetical protein P171DRAFT_46936 [Karstenula rhodostoma CBS 690.94]|uniref:Uncharacterized protein n=1 Tax=Karstenula rhodostoma CBS 690.94 TaxID=1392251 RepID=A0A9P4U9Z6_9PLEO|nr:hypothetical protein P171DRAFT_46936 [Karstenula rhodostoma CBS 690.94]
MVLGNTGRRQRPRSRTGSCAHRRREISLDEVTLGDGTLAFQRAGSMKLAIMGSRRARRKWTAAQRSGRQRRDQDGGAEIRTAAQRSRLRRLRRATRKLPRGRCGTKSRRGAADCIELAIATPSADDVQAPCGAGLVRRPAACFCPRRSCRCLATPSAAPCHTSNDPARRISVSTSRPCARKSSLGDWEPRERDGSLA